MKIYTLAISGKLTPGDVVSAHWCDARGGRTSGGYEVTDKDTIDTVAEGLARSMNYYWLGQFFKIQQQANGRIVIVADGQPAGDIVLEVTGKKTEKLTLSETLNA